MVKFVKALLFSVPSIFMGLILWFIPEIADTTSFFYVLLIGVFLGFDMLAMIKETKKMPEGSYDKVKTWRYILTVCFLSILISIAFIKYKTLGVMKVTLGSFSASIFIISGIIIAGLDGNRIATNKECHDGSQETEVQRHTKGGGVRRP